MTPDELRELADAQPVAWMHADDLRDQDTFPCVARFREHLSGDPVPLFTHPAPAAPQAEQPIDLDAVAMQQMRQAAAESTWMPSEYTSNDWIADVCRWLRDGPPAAAPQAEPKEENNVWKQIIPDDAPQAEPKREPNPDEVICPACTHQFRAIPENVQAQLWAKREPLSDEQIDTALQTYPATLLALMGGEMTVGEFKSALRRLARTVEHAHGISGGGHD